VLLVLLVLLVLSAAEVSAAEVSAAEASAVEALRRNAPHWHIEKVRYAIANAPPRGCQARTWNSLVPMPPAGNPYAASWEAIGEQGASVKITRLGWI